MDWLVYSLQPFSSLANFSRAMFFHPEHARKTKYVCEKHVASKHNLHAICSTEAGTLEEITGDLLLLLEASWTRRCVLLKTQRWICGDIRTDHWRCVKQEKKRMNGHLYWRNGNPAHVWQRAQIKRRAINPH